MEFVSPAQEIKCDPHVATLNPGTQNIERIPFSVLNLLLGTQRFDVYGPLSHLYNLN